METHLRATEHHLPYEITQCYLPPTTATMLAAYANLSYL